MRRVNTLPPFTPRRGAYALSAVAIVASGLVWRSQLLPLSLFHRKYGGDALWAMLVFVLVRWIRPRAAIANSALVAAAIAAAVETSQLYHAPWIDSFRRTRMGLLTIGRTFNWGDLPAYALGVILAALADQIWRRRPAA